MGRVRFGLLVAPWLVAAVLLAAGPPPADAQPPTHIPDPLPATAVMTTATAAVFAILVLGTGGSISPLDVPGDAWLPLLSIGLVAGALAIRTEARPKPAPGAEDEP